MMFDFYDHQTQIFLVTPTRGKGIWYSYRCNTCGVTWHGSSRSKVAMMLDAYRHRHQGPIKEPEHRLSTSVDEYRAITWECTCGWSNTSFHLNERRARQAHSQHKTKALLIWHENRDERYKHYKKRAAEFEERWNGLTDKGREHFIQEQLQKLI